MNLSTLTQLALLIVLVLLIFWLLRALGVDASP